MMKMILLIIQVDKFNWDMREVSEERGKFHGLPYSGNSLERKGESRSGFPLCQEKTQKNWTYLTRVTSPWKVSTNPSG